jgi:hypothetical protein
MYREIFGSHLINGSGLLKHGDFTGRAGPFMRRLLIEKFLDIEKCPDRGAAAETPAHVTV